MTDDEAAAWQARQEGRRQRREKHAAEEREYHVRHSLETLAKYGHPAPGDVEKLKAEHEALKAAHEEAQAELAAARMVVDQDWQVEQIGELTQGLRDRDARDKFYELAREAKANPRALGMLWKLAEHTSETDEPDVKALQTAIERLKDEADYCFKQPELPTPAEQPTARESEPATAASGPRFTFQNGAWKSNGAN